MPPLVAVAHGSADPRAAATIEDLLDVVRARARQRGLAGVDVRTAYLGHAPPSPAQVLGSLGAGRPAHAVLLPLLLTAAYHSKTDIPAILSEARTSLPRLRVSYGEPIGPHPLLVSALERRLAEAAPLIGPLAGARDTAVVLAAAGSSDPAADAVITGIAGYWQAVRGWHAVVPAYASAASPTPGEAVTSLLRSGAPRVVVATYLLAPGLFADQVRRASLAAGAAAVSGALGAAPEIADIILDRYTQAAAQSPQHAAATS